MADVLQDASQQAIDASQQAQDASQQAIDAVDIRLQLERANALVAVARAQHAAGEYAAAVATCDAALRLAPTSAGAFLERSRARLEAARRGSGDAPEERAAALRDARRAAFMRPDSWRCALQESRAYGAAGALAAARAALLRASELAAATGSEAEAAAEAAPALALQEGVLHLAAALALPPPRAAGPAGGSAAAATTTPRARLLRAAVGALDRAVGGVPSSADALVERGRAHLEARALDAALLDFESALRLAPRDDRAMSGRAEAWRRQARLGAAHSSASAALVENPRSLQALATLGRVERDLGRPLAALDWLARAAEAAGAASVEGGAAAASRDEVLRELRMPVPIAAVVDVPIQRFAAGQIPA
jgi:tetratricopeptide (TPR) repeat protein